MIKGVLFDCWNTLFFTDLKPHPYHEFADKIGCTFNDYDFTKLFEKTFMLEKHSDFSMPICTLLDELGIKKEKEFISSLKKILQKTTPFVKPYPDTIPVLDYLKRKYVLGLITNVEYLGEEGLNRIFDLNKYFGVVLKSYETGLLKPDPRVFELALEQLKLANSEVIMVGDSLIDDIQAAERVGIKAILLDRKNKHPDYKNRITSLLELKKVL